MKIKTIGFFKPPFFYNLFYCFKIVKMLLTTTTFPKGKKEENRLFLSLQYIDDKDWLLCVEPVQKCLFQTEFVRMGKRNSE